MTQAELQKHIYKAYVFLRLGLFLLALGFPFLLWGIGSLNGIHLQDSMSEYYFAFAPTTSELRVFPVRVVFVGVLFVLGFFLILYRGFSRTENWMLNIAGVCAFLVALFPMPTPDYCTNCGNNPYSFVHYWAAVVLLTCIAFVAWACTEQTLGELDDDRWRRFFRTCYYVIAIIMIITPVILRAMTWEVAQTKWTYIVETVGTVMFAIYWGLKSWELSKSEAEWNAMKGKVLKPPEPSLRATLASAW